MLGSFHEHALKVRREVNRRSRRRARATGFHSDEVARAVKIKEDDTVEVTGARSERGSH